MTKSALESWSLLRRLDFSIHDFFERGHAERVAHQKSHMRSRNIPDPALLRIAHMCATAAADRHKI